MADLNKLEEKLMAKISELSGSLAEVKTQVTKAFNEIRTKIDTLTAKITELESQIGDADVPQEVVDLVAEIKALGQQLDDIVPDQQ